MLPPPPLHPTIQGPRGLRKFFAVSGIVGVPHPADHPRLGSIGDLPTMEGRRARSAQPSDRVGGVLRPAVLSGRRRPGCRQGCPYWNGQGPRWHRPSTGGRHPRRPARVHVDPRRGWLDDVSGERTGGGFAVELPEGWQPGTVATDVPEEMVFRCQCVRRERWSPDVRDQVPPSGCDRAPARDGRPFGRVRRGRKRHARASGGVASEPACRAKLCRGLESESARRGGH